MDDSTSELEETIAELEDSAAEEDKTASDEDELCSELEDSIAELERTISDEEEIGAMLDELGAIDELDSIELDESVAIEELEIAEELEDCEELDQVDELDDIDDEDLTVISTSKVIYSLSEDSLMLVSEIFMSSPFQKTNLLNEVTFLEPGNGSDGAALVPVVVTASSISTYMWLPSTLIFRLDHTEAT